MMSFDGDIQVSIDERSLEILKTKPIGKKLSALPAQFVMSDEQYLLRNMDLSDTMQSKDAVIA